MADENVQYGSKTSAGGDGSCEFSATKRKAPGTDNAAAERQKRDENQRRKSRISDRKRQCEKDEKEAASRNLKVRIQKAFSVDTVSRRKYRKYMSKDTQVGKVKRVIEHGLDRNVSRRSFDDELHDDSINADEFPREAISDYRREFVHKCSVPTSDTNHDGVVDSDDDVIMTPGMRKMSRYL